MSKLVILMTASDLITRQALSSHAARDLPSDAHRTNFAKKKKKFKCGSLTSPPAALVPHSYIYTCAVYSYTLYAIL